MSKIKVVHFHNGSGGGVLSVIKNLLRYSRNKDIENHVIYTINKDLHPEYKMPELEGAKNQQVFYYSAKWNFYYTCRQLAKLLPDENALVVAHDWLELGMMSNLGLQNPVVQFLHGDYDYYYRLAKNHERAVDSFICVAANIENRLKAELPHRNIDINYLRFPVPDVISEIKERENNILFIGRLEEAKGYSLLPEISRRLMNTKINWHIVGASDGSLDMIKWDENIRVTFYGNIPNEDVMKLLPEMKIILLPSKGEGMPVTIVEAMKAGVIPVVNDLPGGIRELVINNVTGFKIQDNNIDGYVDKIQQLLEDESIAMQMQKECISLANMVFEPIANSNKIEKKFESISKAIRKKKPAIKVYGSRLDDKNIPNTLTNFMRNIKSLPENKIKF